MFFDKQNFLINNLYEKRLLHRYIWLLEKEIMKVKYKLI